MHTPASKSQRSGIKASSNKTTAKQERMGCVFVVPGIFCLGENKRTAPKTHNTINAIGTMSPKKKLSIFMRTPLL